MSSIEQTGKNVEEATELALEQLGVTEDEVDVEILEEGSKGFLGLGQAPARVRVTLREAKPGKARRPAAPERRKPTAPEKKPEVEEPKAIKEEAPPVVEVGDISEKELLSRATEISGEVLQHILAGIDSEAKIAIKSAADGQVVLDMVGGETAMLIGKHGQTINAMQYLVGIITNKRLPQQVRVVLDAEGYRERREETLRSQALYLAKKVKESGQEAVLEPLQPSERRIVHLALADDESIYTYSEGEEPERHVVISPKK